MDFLKLNLRLRKNKFRREKISTIFEFFMIALTTCDVLRKMVIVFLVNDLLCLRFAPLLQLRRLCNSWEILRRNKFHFSMYELTSKDYGTYTTFPKVDNKTPLNGKMSGRSKQETKLKHVNKKKKSRRLLQKQQ